MRIVKLQLSAMICRSNFTVPLRLGLWLVACVGSCLVSRWSPGALAALGQWLFWWTFLLLGQIDQTNKESARSRYRSRRSESFPSIDLGSISIPSILTITLPGTPGDDRHTKLQPFCSARSLLAAKMALHGFGWEIRQNLNRWKHKKNIENIQNTISDDASLLLMSRCWHPLKGRFKAKEIQQRVCFKTCHHLSKRERMRVSLLVPGQRFCRDCIFGHPCRTGLWWKPGHWKQHCMVAWHSAFRQGYTSHTQHQWMSWTPSTRISQKHTLPFSTQDVHRNGCGHISVTCSFTSWGLSYPKR